MKHLGATSLALVALLGIGTFVAPVQAEPGKWVIGMSNAYYGNTWRHQMIASYEAAAKKAKEEGKIAEFITLNGDGTANAQIAQFNDLILRKVDAILVEVASETAINGVIAKACAAGIKVIALDAVPTAPCAWKIADDFVDYGKTGAEGAAKLLNEKGNVLMVRGVKGSGPDHQIYQGETEVLKKYPDMKIVGEVNGDWSGPVAQAAVSAALPGLPHIDAVLDQGGGDAFGILQAFQQGGASYEGHMPVIMGGNETDFVRWWQSEKQKNGYATISVNPTPTISEAAVWYAIAILNGANPPKDQFNPLTVITNENVDQFKDLPPNQVVTADRGEQWVKDNLLKSAK